MRLNKENDLQQERATLERLMENGIDFNEFVVYLQPKYDLKTLQLVSAEALLRWDSKELGFLLPGAFISLLEKSGMIVDVDFFVLEQVCKKIQNWIQKGVAPVQISVNQSRLHAERDDYIKRLCQVLKNYDISPEYIELEVTEQMFLDNEWVLVNAMKELQSHGFRVSIDDFGTGYSSLMLLKELPVDILKLDKLFLRDIDDARNQIILFQVIEMAHKLGSQVVCEGAENRRQINFLQKIKCDIVQGFYFARPMPMHMFPK